MKSNTEIEFEGATLSIVQGDALADRLIALRDDASPQEDRETLLLAANLVRKAVPALLIVDAVVRHCRATMTPAETERLDARIAKALSE